MTVKFNITDIITLLFITILTIWAVAYGFTLIPTPEAKQAANYDTVRTQRLKSLESGITAYHQTNRKLPMDIAEVTAEDKNYVYPSSKASKTFHLDPETNEAFEYIVEDKLKYKLCATFKTSTMNTEEAEPSIYSAYSGYASNKYAKHEKGKKCFDGQVYDYSYGGSYTYPSPTMTCLGGNCPKATPTPSRLPSSYYIPGATSSAIPTTAPAYY